MKSIRRHLTIGLLGVFVVLLGAGSLVIYFSTRAAVLAQVDARLRVEALAVVKQTKQERNDEEEPGKHQGKPPPEGTQGRELEVGFTEKYMPEFESGGREFYQVWSPGAMTVKRSHSLNKADLPRRFGTVDKPAFWNFVLPNGTEVRGVGMTFVPPTPASERKWHDPHFQATLAVATGLGGLNQTLATLRGVLFTVSGLGLLATLVSVPFLVRRGLLPLHRVADQVSLLEADKLQARFSAENMPVELRPICLRLNELLSRLERSFERERRFSADVAHELRTPIAELRSLAEVSLQWPPSDEGQGQAFQDALAIAVQMEAIVTTLLAIARCEAGRQPVKREPVNLARLVEECWRPFEAQAKNKNLHVNFHLSPQVQAQTDPAMLGLILTNLFSNAVEYTPPGEAVEVRFAKAQSLATLSVTNVVENLTSDDLPKLFERFWRKDTVRSSSEHIGLGLALSKACAEMLGVKLVAELTSERTIRVAVAGL